MSKPQKKKNYPTSNVLESLKELGTSTAKSMSQDVLRQSDFFNQIFGTQKSEKFSGDITPGESLEINDIYTGKREEDQKLRQQIALERKLLEEERVRTEKKTNELKIQLNSIIEEVRLVSEKTSDLTQEIKVATLQAPIEPGVYHVIFFEKLLELIKSFRKKIDDAAVWLNGVNKRAQKKNFWGQYKTHGAKFLLSGEHYSGRNAG